MDAVEPFSVECREDRSSLVCVWASPRATSRCAFYSRLWHRQSGSLCLRSGQLSGFRRLHENSCLEDGRQLFRLTALDQKHSTLSKQTSAAVTGHATNSVKARLRQCHTGRSPCISDRSTSMNTARSSTFGEWLAQIWPCLFIALGPSLVASPRAYQVSTGLTWLVFVAVSTLHLSTCRGTYTGSLTTTPGDACDRQRHTSWWYLGLCSAPSAIVHLELPALVCGTIYRLLSSLRHQWPCSRIIWRLTFSALLQLLTSTRLSQGSAIPIQPRWHLQVRTTIEIKTKVLMSKFYLTTI